MDQGRQFDEQRQRQADERFGNAVRRQPNANKPIDRDLLAEALKLAKQTDGHDHDYSEGKYNDTCSECGMQNPNDTYDKGKD